MRKEYVEEQLKKRKEYEEDKMGGYSLIYPCEDQERSKKYGQLMKKIAKVLDHKKIKIKRKESLVSQRDVDKMKGKSLSKKK